MGQGLKSQHKMPNSHNRFVILGMYQISVELNGMKISLAALAVYMSPVILERQGLHAFGVHPERLPRKCVV